VVALALWCPPLPFHIAVARGAFGGKGGAAPATAAAADRQRRATPTGGAVTPPRSAPAHGGQGGWRTGGRVGPTTARRGASGHRGRVETRKSRRAVAGRNSGRWGATGGQAPSRPCDPCGRTFLLRHVTPFAVIADPRILSWWTETDLRTDSLHQSDALLGLPWCS